MEAVYVLMNVEDDGDIDNLEECGWKEVTRLVDVFSTEKGAIEALEAWKKAQPAKVVEEDIPGLIRCVVAESLHFGRNTMYIERKEVKP